MTGSADIIVSGHLCLDLLPNMEHINPADLTSAGKLFEIGALNISTGGAVSNTGLALHRLGANVALMSSVGDDLLGQMILSFLNLRDPSLTRHIRIISGVKSSYTIVLSPQKMDRVFLHCTGTNQTFDSHVIDYTLLEGAQIFHLGYPPILPRLFVNDGDELVAIFQRAKAVGVITSLDMSLPDSATASGQANWRLILQRVLPYVDIFVPSVEETLFALRHHELHRGGTAWHEFVTRQYLRELAAELLDMGDLAVVGFKLSEYGVYLRAGSGLAIQRLLKRGIQLEAVSNQESYHQAFEVEVAGTTGAGDSAYAALLMALTRGLTLDECARWMCAVGAHNVEAADATSGIRTWEETNQRMNAGWQKNHKQILGE